MSSLIDRKRFASFSMGRVLAYSASITFNIAALLALMIPMNPSLVGEVERMAPFTITFLEPPPPPPVVLPVEVPVVNKIKIADVDIRPPVLKSPPVVRPKVDQVRPSPAPPATTEPSAMAFAADPSPPGDLAPSLLPAGPVASPGPVEEVSLGYRSTPLPAYPLQARRMRWEGTVRLKVLVDVDGRPLQVTVVGTSGHRLLDEAARDQVLAKWRFQPAVVGGRAVQAWGQVPVTFKLGE